VPETLGVCRGGCPTEQARAKPRACTFPTSESAVPFAACPIDYSQRIERRSSPPQLVTSCAGVSTDAGRRGASLLPDSPRCRFTSSSAWNARRASRSSSEAATAMPRPVPPATLSASRGSSPCSRLTLGPSSRAPAPRPGVDAAGEAAAAPDTRRGAHSRGLVGGVNVRRLGLPSCPGALGSSRPGGRTARAPLNASGPRRARSRDRAAGMRAPAGYALAAPGARWGGAGARDDGRPPPREAGRSARYVIVAGSITLAVAPSPKPSVSSDARTDGCAELRVGPPSHGPEDFAALV
jgi:hypothetical protein